MFSVIKKTLNEKGTLTMQAESATEQMDWIEKITGVIASLLTSQTPERVNGKMVLCLFLLCYLITNDDFFYASIFVSVPLVKIVPLEVLPILIKGQLKITHQVGILPLKTLCVHREVHCSYPPACKQENWLTH